jgi:hypothetical protein
MSQCSQFIGQNRLIRSSDTGETLEPEETGDEAETIDDIKMKLAVERHLKEDALSHVLEVHFLVDKTAECK